MSDFLFITKSFNFPYSFQFIKKDSPETVSGESCDI
jgi:hypothetical protein